MEDAAKVLQLGIHKSRLCMEALINDTATTDLDILLIGEPPVSQTPPWKHSGAQNNGDSTHIHTGTARDTGKPLLQSLVQC